MLRAQVGNRLTMSTTAAAASRSSRSSKWAGEGRQRARVCTSGSGGSVAAKRVQNLPVVCEKCIDSLRCVRGGCKNCGLGYAGLVCWYCQMVLFGLGGRRPRIAPQTFMAAMKGGQVWFRSNTPQALTSCAPAVALHTHTHHPLRYCGR